MTTSYARPSRAFRLKVDDRLITSDVKKMLWDALSSPSAQTAEMRLGIDILKHVASGDMTGTSLWPIASPSSTTSSSRQFDSVLALVTDVIDGLEATEEWPDVFEDARPEMVRAGWSDYLSSPFVEDADFVLPWLDDCEE